MLVTPTTTTSALPRVTKNKMCLKSLKPKECALISMTKNTDMENSNCHRDWGQCSPIPHLEPGLAAQKAGEPGAPPLQQDQRLLLTGIGKIPLRCSEKPGPSSSDTTCK